MKQFFGKRSRNALGLVLLISLSIHIVAVIIFGTIKFVTEQLREEPELQAVEIAPPTPEPPRSTVNVEQRTKSTPPPRLQTIVVNNPTEMDIPELNIDVNVDTSSVVSRDAGSFGGGGLKGVRNMAVSANLFGMQISSSGLGVVLDITGSAHAHLDKAITEIDSNFPTAYIILVVGCGMTETDGTNRKDSPPGKPRVVEYNQRGSNEKYDKLSRSGPAQMEQFFRKIGAKRSEELRKYFTRRDNLYFLYGGDIVAANYAFEYLIKQNVDTIYWFADFADRVDKPVIEKLTKELQRNSIKAFAHNFMGRPVRPDVVEMTDATGGKSIALIPGQDKKK